MSPGKKLAVAGTVIAAVTGYMAYVGASSSWKYYLTTDECAAQGAQLIGQRMRVSGRIAPGSLQIAADRRQADFCLQGQSGSLTVACQGTLPDNLADAMDVVVEGRLESRDRLVGDKVLTRCASKYEARPAALPASIPAQEAPGGS